MKVAVVTVGNPLDIKVWSGIPYYMTKKLLSLYPDLLIVESPRPLWIKYARNIIHKLTRGFIDIYWNRTLSRWNATRIASDLLRMKVDVVLCICNAPISAYIAEKIPTIHISDATVPLLTDYYDEFTQPKLMLSNALHLDRKSVLNSRACLYPTGWAAESAIRNFGANPNRVHVIPWGANLESRKVSHKKHGGYPDTCHLVFVGLDWKRKGGDLAVAAAKQLVAEGHSVKLHIVGSSPEINAENAIIVHGFIDKKTEEGRRRLDQIMEHASFLFVPTRQDCFGIVFSEANSYGVPVIATRTGGVPDVVLEGVNGHLLSSDATADDYAQLIWTIWSDPDRYSRLRDSSWLRFNEALNWDSWLTQAAKIIVTASAETSV